MDDHVTTATKSDAARPPSKGAHRFAGMTKDDRRKARHHLFIEAGIAIVGVDGIDRVTLREACTRAGLTERFFYESFASVDSFTEAVVSAVAMRIATRLFTQVAPIQDGRDRVRAVAHELVTMFEEDRRLGRIVLIETVRAGGKLAQVRQTALNFSASLTRQWLDNPGDSDWLSTFTPVATQILGNETASTAQIGRPDPLSVALAGAVAETLVAWLNDQLDLSAPQLVTFLTEFLDQATSADH